MILSMLLAAILGNTPVQAYALNPAVPAVKAVPTQDGTWVAARVPQIPLRKVPPRPTAAANNNGSNDAGDAFAAPADAVVQPDPKKNQGGVFDQDLRKSKAKFSFEFSKAEILDVVKAISDMTKMNFIVPEKIKGQRISILSPTHITADEAYQVFFTALASNGISLVRIGRFHKLVDSKDSFKDVIPTCIDDDPACVLGHEQMVTLLLHLHHADAGQINAVVKTLMSKDGDVMVYTPSNAMIISEYGPNLKRLRRIVETLDVPGGDDDLQLLQIQYSAASELAEKITQIFEISNKPTNQGGPRPMPLPGLQQGSGSDLNEISISKIVADDRTNQLIIKANRRSFAAVKNLIAKLDVPISEAEQGKVHVYYLENAKAEDLASTLSSLASGTPSNQKNRPGAPSAAPTQPGGPGAAGKGGETASLFEGEVKITSDKATNSLLVMSSAHDYRAVRNIIEKLDMPRRQVYVEAAIMEINLDDTEQIGMSWHAPISHDNISSLSTQSLGFIQSSQSGDRPSPTIGALYNVSGLLTAAGGSLAGLFGPPKAVTLGDNSPFSIPTFGLLLKWLQTNANTNILSSPHLLTTDNEQAHIEVGNKIPFNTGAFGGAASALGGLGGGAGGSAGGLGALGALGGIGALGGLGSVQRIDVSLKLTLTPQINERGKIRLEIDQTVEDVSTTDAKSQSPSTSHRSLKTVVVVDDQQTIVLGGLIRDRTSETETKIPFLGDLPLLGYLFKTHNFTAQKVNLLLVLTPYIISSQGDFQRIFERKMAESDEFAAQYFGHRKEYRAYIDYTKKTGPLSRMVATLRRERDKYENGGGGDGTAIMVQPKRAPTLNPPKPEGDAPPASGDGDPATQAVPGGASNDSPASPDAQVEVDSGDLQEQPDAAGKGSRVSPKEAFKEAPAVEPDDSFVKTPDHTQGVIPETKKGP